LSVPYADPSTWIPLAVLSASLLGSGHCVAMCGGLVVAAARTPLAWTAYHAGRLLGYLALGSLAGLIGSILFDSEEAWLGVLPWLSWAAAIALGISFGIAGVRVWQGRPLHLSLVPSSVLARLFKAGSGNAGLTGFLTAFLPCGWLHSFVLGAIATRSPLLGAGFLAAFWAGTLPALGLAPWVFERVFKPVSRRSPKVAAVILILAGALSLGMKVAPQARHAFSSDAASDSEETGHCH
jgi:sulfite exporter TauE/SafE